MRKSISDILAGLGFLGFAAVFWLSGRDLTGISRVFPESLELFLSLGGAALVAGGLRRLRREVASAGEEAVAACAQEEPVVAWRVALITVSSMAYVLLIPALGFYAASVLFMFGMGWVMAGRGQGLRGPAKAMGFALFLSLLVYLVFTRALQVPTPEGLLL